MTKLKLADLILRYLYQQKEQNEYYDCTDSESLAKELNDQNNDLSVTKDQVSNAVKYLHDRSFIKGPKGMGVGVLRFSITPEGEDLVDSGFSVQDVSRHIFESQVSTTNTTIHGNVNQFAQGENNTQIQNNHVETVDDKFEELYELLEQHGETKLANEVKAEKKSGGPRKALTSLSKKLADSFSTKAGQELAMHVMPFIPKILELLPPQ